MTFREVRMRRCDSRSRPPRAGRFRGPALAAAGVAALGLLAVRLGEVTRSAWSAVAAGGPASPDDAVAALAATGGLALIAWLAAAVTLSLAAAAAGNRSPTGRVLDRAAARIAPVILRNAAAAVLGVVVVTTPAAAQAAVTTSPPAAAQAFAASSSPAPVVAVRSAVAHQELSPAWLPIPADRAAPRGDDLQPGWVPTRPLDAPGARAHAAAPVLAAPRRAAASQASEVVVRRGDTLWSIAARHLGPGATDAEIALDWPHWFTANRAVVGSDPDLLRPGQRLRPPPATSHEDRSPRPGTTGTTGGRR
jgi:nucleoid-associated protein YgaU